MASFPPVSTAFVGLATLARRPDTLLAWTLFQLPVGALSAGVLWFVSSGASTEVIATNVDPSYFIGALLVVVAFSVLWRPMLRSVALRAGIDPTPGAAWRLRWGRAETTLLLFSFTKSGPAPWLENFLAGLVLIVALVLCAFLWALSPVAAVVLYAVATFAVVIWLRVRSSLTFALVVDPEAHAVKRGGTWNWLQVRRVGWELTGRHLGPLIAMETITFSLWLAVSAVLAGLAIVGLGGADLVRTAITTPPADVDAWLNGVLSRMHTLPITVYAVVALWIAVVSALHMILCSLPTATAYLALRPEEQELARQFA